AVLGGETQRMGVVKRSPAQRCSVGLASRLLRLGASAAGRRIGCGEYRLMWPEGARKNGYERRQQSRWRQPSGGRLLSPTPSHRRVSDVGGVGPHFWRFSNSSLLIPLPTTFTQL